MTPCPATEATLCYYVACLGQEGLTHATIRTYLSGVRQLQISLGFPELGLHAMPRLRQVLQGVRTTVGRQGRTPRTRLPITPSILKKMKMVWAGPNRPVRPVSQDNWMLWAAATTTFFTFCRAGETTVGNGGVYDPQIHLSLKDVAADNTKRPTVISLQLKQTKTDQIRKGVKVIMGRTGDELCPVTALLHYLSLRGAAPGPLFQWTEGTPLSRVRFAAEVRLALDRAQLPAKDFAGHSFRIGAATTAAAAGLEDSTIQTLGRWKSAAYLLYVKIDPRRLAKVSQSLASCQI